MHFFSLMHHINNNLAACVWNTVFGVRVEERLWVLEWCGDGGPQAQLHLLSGEGAYLGM